MIFWPFLHIINWSADQPWHWLASWFQLYPGPQSHVWEPYRLTHVRSREQPPLAVEHSSSSEIIRISIFIRISATDHSSRPILLHSISRKFKTCESLWLFDICNEKLWRFILMAHLLNTLGEAFRNRLFFQISFSSKICFSLFYGNLIFETLRQTFLTRIWNHWAKWTRTVNNT